MSHPARHTRSAVNCTKALATHIPEVFVTCVLNTPWILINAPDNNAAYRSNIEQLTLNALAILAYDHNISTGVEAVDTDNSAVVATEYYNLQGARIANPENGIYIVKRVMESGKVATSKEIIK